MVKLNLAALAGLFILTTPGCSSINLGRIDETPDPREEMPGPGIFTNDEGESKLAWPSKSQSSHLPEADSLDQNHPDSNEFELFKQWKAMRSDCDQSEACQEFLLWLEFHKMTQQ